MALKTFNVVGGLSIGNKGDIFDANANLNLSNGIANVTLGNVSNLHISGGNANGAILGTVTLNGSGNVTNIAIISRGDGYTIPPAITISGPNSIGANATVSLFGNGAINTITINDPGTGYSSGTVTASISGPSSRYLRTDGEGNLSWYEVQATGGGGGGTPGGANTQIQFNDNGSFGGQNGFTFDKTSNAVTANGNVTATNFITSGTSGNIIGANNVRANSFIANSNVLIQSGTGYYINISGNTSSTNSYDLVLPVDVPGTNGQVLAGNTDGTTQWVSISSNSITNGNSNVVVEANANVTISSNGLANIVVVSSDATNGLVTINGNLAANNFTTTGSAGNISGANVISANLFKTTSNGAVALLGNNGTTVQQVELLASTDAGFTANYSLTLPVNAGSSGQYLQTDGTGILSWASVSTSSLANGNSNVTVEANSNVTISVAGNANVLTVTGTGANLSGNLAVRDTIYFANTTDANITLATIQGGVGTNGNGIILTTGSAPTDGVQVVGSGRIQSTNGSAALILDNAGNVRVSANVEVGYLTPNSAVVFTANGNTLALYASNALSSTYSLYLPPNVAQSNGQILAANTDGSTQWVDISTSSISNGTSNVSIPVINGNVNISSAGNANVLVVTGTGANITGTANVSGNANVGNLGTDTAIITTGNITTVNTGLVQNGNSNIAITANSNITLTAKSNATMVISDTGANITGTGNISGNLDLGANLTANSAANVTFGDNTWFYSGYTTLNTGGIFHNTGANPDTIQVSTNSLANGIAMWTLGLANQYITSTGGFEFVTGATLHSNTNPTGGTSTASITSDGLFVANITANVLQNGNANIRIAANGNIGISANGQSNVLTITSNGTHAQAVFQNDVTVTGNLTVSGNSIYANTEILVVEDPIIELGTGSNGAILTTNDSKDRGLVLHTYGNGAGYTTSGSTPIGNTTIVLTSTSGIVAGQLVTCALNPEAIPVGTTVSTVNAGNIVISNATTNTIATTTQLQIGNDTLRFMGWSNANGEFQFYSNAINTNEVISGTLGNVNAAIFIGNLVGTVTGNLQNGNSNVRIAANANVTISANGNANIFTVTSSGDGNLQTTGVNVAGYINSSANIIAANFVGVFANGNSNISIPAANGNVNISAIGNANVLVITGTGANITGTANVTGNANVGNLGTATAIITTGNITTINSGLLQNGNSNITLTSNANITLTANGNSVITVTSSGDGNLETTGANVDGYIDATGNINGANLVVKADGSLTFTTGGSNVSSNTLTTTTTTANQALAVVAAADGRAVEFIVKAIDASGEKYSATTILALVGNAANADCDYTAFAQLNTGLTTGDISVALTDSNANITLQVTPASTNSTVWTTQFRVI